MAGTLVHVVGVSLDPPSIRVVGRTRYRITLACGCFWWEDRDALAPAPEGRARTCYHVGHAQQSERIATTPHRAAVAADES